MSEVEIYLVGFWSATVIWLVWGRWGLRVLRNDLDSARAKFKALDAKLQAKLTVKEEQIKIGYEIQFKLHTRIKQLQKDLTDKDQMIEALAGDIILLQAKLDIERAKVKSHRAISMN